MVWSLRNELISHGKIDRSRNIMLVISMYYSVFKKGAARQNGPIEKRRLPGYYQ
jgi:hypothetical protein